MMRRVACDKCKSLLEYDDKSVWEGNRDREEVICPVCRSVVASVFTDLIVNVRVIKKGDGVE